MAQQQQVANFSSENSSDDEPDEQEEQGKGKAAYYQQQTTTDESDDGRKRKFSQTTDEDEVVSKKPKLGFDAKYSTPAQLMMQKMGYRQNEGLGRLGQGIKDPILASQQKGRRGLGTKLVNMDRSASKFESDSEKITIPEQVDWLENYSDDLHELTRDVLDQWVARGPEKLVIEDEDRFVEPKILHDMLEAKTAFDELDADDMLNARTKSNPFETIKGAIFLNRAAVKMANIDALLGYMFSNPVDQYGHQVVKNDELLYFADVCAGPGGFSEYILWRKKWHAKGFGFTLKGKCDFDLSKFLVGNPETFDPYYGVNDDGDVFNPDNITSLTDYILKQTDTGVHFMMADGGFSVKGQENLQEIISKQLYLCQCLVGLNVVRENGHLVIKMFDLLTPFSVGLLYLMWKCFQQICILKPNTSRPANSERYLVCKWKRANTDTIQRHLFEVNQHLHDKNSTTDWEDILELVPMSVLEADKEFFDYIVSSNNRIGENQIVGLMKIAAYCQDNTLQETRQEEIRKKCLQEWQIPDKLRTPPQTINTDNYLVNLLADWKADRFFTSKDKEFKDKADLDNVFKDFQDHWYFVPLDINDTSKYHRTFFMSRGRRDVYMYTNSRWMPLQSIYVEMSPKTLVYGEVVKELEGQDRGQKIIYALHIIDGIILGGEDIRKLPLKERLAQCQKFAHALNKPYKNEELLAPIRCKSLFRFRDIANFFNNMEDFRLKDRNIRKGFKLRNTNGRFYVPRGLMFINELKSHIGQGLSKSHNKIYYFDTMLKKSFFLEELQDPKAILGSFRSTFPNRYLWKWDEIDQINEPNFDCDLKDLNRRRDSDLIYRGDLERIMKKRIT